MKALVYYFGTGLRGSSIDRAYWSLWGVVLFAAVMAKGPVVFRGYAIDDYGFGFGLAPGGLDGSIGQGRYVSAGIIWAINSLGVNISDTYFAFGILALILQVTFVISMLRFIGADKHPSAGLIGALIVTHPYLAEILTFRLALPFYCAALVFSVICLEMIAKHPTDWRARSIAFGAALAMLFTYQSFLNYFAVIVIFSLILDKLANAHAVQSAFQINYRQRVFALMVVSAASLIAFFAVTKIFGVFLLPASDKRSNFVTLDMMESRIGEVSKSLLDIYWVTQPILPGWIKVVILALVFGSIVSIFLSIKINKRFGEYVHTLFFVMFLLFLLIPISLGVILPFQNWWPVPRVVAHVAVIIGLILVTADLCYSSANKGVLRIIVVSLMTLLISAFVLINNQIFADQLRLNNWDRSLANRIVARLEENSRFQNIKYLHISGGQWAFPSGLRSIIGDLNISATFPNWSKFHLISEASGYKFEPATTTRFDIGEGYCKGRSPWPHKDSVAVIDDLGIVCLNKNE